MQITAGNLASVFTGLKATFAEAVQSTDDEQINRTMEAVPSTAGTENYPVATLHLQ